jgi:uncharacterized membrane protein
MSGQQLALFFSVFLACAVEAVEALTIVLAIGITRGWESAFAGIGAALAVLAAVVAVLGPALVALPIDVLRVVVGGLLLVFGLQWLRKAILRAAGVRATRDEAALFELELAAAAAVGAPGAARARSALGGDENADVAAVAGGRRLRRVPRGRIDRYGFAIVFKGVLLEGLEVAFIVLTFGANQHRVGTAAAAAGLAVLLVAAVGLLARAPLAAVPENAMKFAVGVMLCSFGMFWGAEGAGAAWPGADAALLVIVPGMLLASLGLVWLLRQRVDGDGRADGRGGRADVSRRRADVGPERA